MKPIGNIKEEWKKIIFPTKGEFAKAFKSIILFSIVYLIMVNGFDFIFQALISKILKL